MKTTILRKTLVIATLALLGTAAAGAQNGEPVGVSATANFSTVSLTWQPPTSPITIQWHDGEDYNGMDGQPLEQGGPQVIYAANRFTAADIAAHAGQTVESISFYEYRPVTQVNVQIYEDKQLVRDQVADLANFVKDSWRTCALAEPYVVPQGKEVMFVARYEAGANFSFIAITDRYPQPGKGDVYSYDGKNWSQGAVGDFLITANVANNADQEPQGYNVYRDGQRINDTPLTDTSLTLTDEPDGEHTYVVTAVYADGERQAYPITLNVTSAASLAAPASTFDGVTNELDGLLAWTSPLQGGSTLTWSTDANGLNIGGTAATNTRVWIKHEFDKNDMLAFQNYRIDSVSAFIAEQSILSATVFVMRDGRIVQSQPVPDSLIQAIQAPAWNTFSVGKSYKMETGHTYAYGIYYTHTPQTHPVGVDNGTGVEGKGNAFSTSSPSSTFSNSNPTWRTLGQGDLAGNFMLKAHVSPVGQPTPPLTVAGYDLYRDGQLLQAGITEMDYIDRVEQPGAYDYRLVTRYEGGKTGERNLSLTYQMPAAYQAPLIIKSDFNAVTKEVSIEWNAEATDLQKYGTASYMVGFDEDMAMLYGAKFTADELAPYVGYKFGKIKFGVGEAMDFSVQIRTGDNQLLWNMDFDKDEVDPLTLYTISIPDDVRIPEGKDIYLAYKATLPGGTDPILIDGGPLVDGGAMVSLADGAAWMKLGTINATYNNYNIVIGATIMPAGSEQQNVGLVQLGAIDHKLHAVTLSADDARNGVEADRQAAGARKAPARSEKPTPVSYRIYRNNKLHAQTEQTTFTEVLNKYGVVEYYVTTIFSNGWESPASRTVSFENKIAQLSQAPYDLLGEPDGADLNLSWTAPGNTQEINYMTDLDNDLQVSLTHSSGKVTSYQAIRFDTDTLPSLVGKTLTHVKFKLMNTVNWATVVVMLGDNIIFEQEVENPVVGWNVVRLNQPYTIPEGLTLPLGFGYGVNYASGNRCMGLDPAPAIPMANDVISTSLEAGYWYSLMTRYKQNYGWRISGVLQTPDQEVTLRRAPGLNDDESVTYNIYRDGQLLAEGVTETAYIVTDAQPGSYTVTAVEQGNESAPSNVVKVNVAATTGDVNLDGMVDIADINILINIMLGRDKAENYAGRADLNGDGNTDIADINAVINAMLGK